MTHYYRQYHNSSDYCFPPSLLTVRGLGNIGQYWVNCCELLLANLARNNFLGRLRFAGGATGGATSPWFPVISYPEQATQLPQEPPTPPLVEHVSLVCWLIFGQIEPPPSSGVNDFRNKTEQDGKRLISQLSPFA